MKGQTIFEFNEVTNQAQDSKSFNRVNCYNVQIENFSAFAVQIVDKEAGVIIIGAGQSLEFKGHPYAPANINFTIRFNAIAPATDFITIKTSCLYGNFEKC